MEIRDKLTDLSHVVLYRHVDRHVDSSVHINVKNHRAAD